MTGTSDVVEPQEDRSVELICPNNIETTNSVPQHAESL